MASVRILADRVDDIQLLFFESLKNTRLDHPVDVRSLKSIADVSGLSYTVHLPTDIRLGADDPKTRGSGVDEIVRLVQVLDDLSPLCFDLHLCGENLPCEQWKENLNLSLSRLAGEMGEAVDKLAVENIDYPLSEVVPLLKQYGIPVCLDFGHAERYGHGREQMMAFLPDAVHIHYHGVQDGRDHRAISPADVKDAECLGQDLVRNGFSGVLTLEMYDLNYLESSFNVLERAWKSIMNQP